MGNAATAAGVSPAAVSTIGSAPPTGGAVPEESSARSAKDIQGGVSSDNWGGPSDAAVLAVSRLIITKQIISRENAAPSILLIKDLLRTAGNGQQIAVLNKRLQAVQLRLDDYLHYANLSSIWECIPGGVGSGRWEEHSPPIGASSDVRSSGSYFSASGSYVRPFVSKSLRERLNNQFAPLTVTEKLFAAFQMCVAVLQLHSIGCYHGCISLNNFLITAGGTVYLVDIASAHKPYALNGPTALTGKTIFFENDHFLSHSVPRPSFTYFGPERLLNADLDGRGLQSGAHRQQSRARSLRAIGPSYKVYASDVFALGQCLKRLFRDELSTLTSEDCTSVKDASRGLSRKNLHMLLQELIEDMTGDAWEQRLDVLSCIERCRLNGIFPEFFYSLMLPLLVVLQHPLFRNANAATLFLIHHLTAFCDEEIYEKEVLNQQAMIQTLAQSDVCNLPLPKAQLNLIRIWMSLSGENCSKSVSNHCYGTFFPSCLRHGNDWTDCILKTWQKGFEAMISSAERRRESWMIDEHIGIFMWPDSDQLEVERQAVAQLFYGALRYPENTSGSPGDFYCKSKLSFVAGLNHASETETCGDRCSRTGEALPLVLMLVSEAAKATLPVIRETALLWLAAVRDTFITVDACFDVILPFFVHCLRPEENVRVSSTALRIASQFVWERLAHDPRSAIFVADHLWPSLEASARSTHSVRAVTGVALVHSVAVLARNRYCYNTSPWLKYCASDVLNLFAGSPSKELALCLVEAVPDLILAASGEVEPVLPYLISMLNSQFIEVRSTVAARALNLWVEQDDSFVSAVLPCVQEALSDIDDAVIAAALFGLKPFVERNAASYLNNKDAPPNLRLVDIAYSDSLKKAALHMNSRLSLLMLDSNWYIVRLALDCAVALADCLRRNGYWNATLSVMSHYGTILSKRAEYSTLSQELASLSLGSISRSDPASRQPTCSVKLDYLLKVRRRSLDPNSFQNKKYKKTHQFLTPSKLCFCHRLGETKSYRSLLARCSGPQQRAQKADAPVRPRWLSFRSFITGDVLAALMYNKLSPKLWNFSFDEQETDDDTYRAEQSPHCDLWRFIMLSALIDGGKCTQNGNDGSTLLDFDGQRGETCELDRPSTWWPRGVLRMICGDHSSECDVQTQLRLQKVMCAENGNGGQNFLVTGPKIAVNRPQNAKRASAVHFRNLDALLHRVETVHNLPLLTPCAGSTAERYTFSSENPPTAWCASCTSDRNPVLFTGNSAGRISRGADGRLTDIINMFSGPVAHIECFSGSMGRCILTQDSTGTLVLYDIRERRYSGKFRLRDSGCDTGAATVLCLWEGDASALFATGDTLGWVHGYDLRLPSRPLVSINVDGSVSHLEFRDTKSAVVAYDSTCAVLALDCGAEIATFTANSPNTFVQRAPGGADCDRKLAVRQKTKKLSISAMYLAINEFQVQTTWQSRASELIILGYNDGSLQLVDMTTQKPTDAELILPGHGDIGSAVTAYGSPSIDQNQRSWILEEYRAGQNFEQFRLQNGSSEQQLYSRTATNAITDVALCSSCLGSSIPYLITGHENGFLSFWR